MFIGVILRRNHRFCCFTPFDSFSKAFSLILNQSYFALSEPLNAIVFSGSSVAKYTSFVPSYSEKSFRDSFFSLTCSFKMRSLCFAKLRLARAETSSSEIFNSLESASRSTIFGGVALLSDI